MMENIYLGSCARRITFILLSTAESKGETRFSDTSVDVQQIIVTNSRNGNQA